MANSEKDADDGTLCRTMYQTDMVDRETNALGARCRDKAFEVASSRRGSGLERLLSVSLGVRSIVKSSTPLLWLEVCLLRGGGVSKRRSRHSLHGGLSPTPFAAHSNTVRTSNEEEDHRSRLERKRSAL